MFATSAGNLNPVFFDLALQLEGSTDLPVDVEHVLAAIVLAARNWELVRVVKKLERLRSTENSAC